MDLTWILAGIASAAVLVWAWRAQRTKFADEYFDGVTPGLVPVGAQPEHRVPVTGGAEYSGEIAVAFNPPRGVRPGLAGTVVDGKPESRDVMATLVDLAARGHLTITIVEDDTRRTGKDWQLHAADVPPRDELEPTEQQLLHAVFSAGPQVRLSELPRQSNHAFNDHQFALANESYERGFFRLVTGMHPVRLVWIAAGLLLMLGFATTSGVALAAAAVLGLGGALIGARSTQRPVRTAEGTAVRIQTLGFKRYLETAEKEQFSYEEAAGIFSKYLPWAIVLGVAGHWVKVFGDLAAQARAEGYDDGLDLMWLGVAGWGMHDAMFTLAMFSAMDGFGGDLGGLGDGAGFGDAFADGGGLFDSGTIDGLGADAGGALDGGIGGDGGFGGMDGGAGADAGGWGGGDGGGWGDFGGGGGDFGGGFGD